MIDRINSHIDQLRELMKEPQYVAFRENHERIMNCLVNARQALLELDYECDRLKEMNDSDSAE